MPEGFTAPKAANDVEFCLIALGGSIRSPSQNGFLPGSYGREVFQPRNHVQSHSAIQARGLVFRAGFPCCRERPHNIRLVCLEGCRLLTRERSPDEFIVSN